MNRPRGFTLIELMIAVAIIAILAAIAIPSYSDYVRRSRITEAMSALSGMRVKMEQYFQDNRTYAGACVAGTVAAPPHDRRDRQLRLRLPDRRRHHLRRSRPRAGTRWPGFVYTLNDQNVRATTALPTGWTLTAALLGPEEGRVVLSRPAPRGFTLVELLVGMTLLAMLMALGAPSMSTYLQNAKIASATSALLLRRSRPRAPRRSGATCRPSSS